MRLPVTARFLILSSLFCFLCVITPQAEAATEAPINVQVAVLTKVLKLNKSLSGDIVIHVVGNDAFAEAMMANKGMDLGGMKIADITTGGAVPSGTAHVIYLGDIGQLDAVIAHSRANSIMTITGIPELVAKGISLGVGLEGGKPEILLNTGASKAENVNWNPAILKISSKVD